MKSLILLFIGAIISIEIYAQRVYVDNAGRVVIDCCNMDDDFISKDKKDRTTDATESCYGTNSSDNLSSEVSNQKVYYQFQVSTSDGDESDWVTAMTKNNVWRLPTQRELMLIYALQPELEEQSGFEAFIPASYWSATESLDYDPSYEGYSYSLNFKDGTVVLSPKSTRLYVRYVRDM